MHSNGAHQSHTFVGFVMLGLNSSQILLLLAQRIATFKIPRLSGCLLTAALSPQNLTTELLTRCFNMVKVYKREMGASVKLN